LLLFILIRLGVANRRPGHDFTFKAAETYFFDRTFCFRLSGFTGYQLVSGFVVAGNRERLGLPASESGSDRPAKEV
jgi:hypothetical protein